MAVLGALRRSPHASVDTLAHAARQTLSVSTQAVYDIVRALTDVGLARCIEPAGSVARYEVDTGDNHHHLVCRSCGTVVDADCTVGAAPCLTPSDEQGFVVDEAEVVFWGYCAGCQRQPVTS